MKELLLYEQKRLYGMLGVILINTILAILVVVLGIVIKSRM